MKINHISLSRMRNAAYVQFLTEFIKSVQEYTPEALKITSPFSECLRLHNKVDLAFKNIIKSSITEQMLEADKARDEIWDGLRETNTTALKHFDPVVREAAKRLKIVFDTYGNIAIKPFNEQTALTTNIIQDFEGKYLADATAVGLKPWILEMKARNITFANLARDRYDEGTQKTDIVLKKARAELDKVYYAIVEFINALVVVEGAANYAPFIRKLNLIIAKFSLSIAQVAKRKKGKKADES